MSYRIDRFISGDNLTVLRVSGDILGQDVDTLRNLLRQEAGALAIDLNNVSLVDREAVQLLVLTEDSGMELRNCPAYIREWVTRERVGSCHDQLRFCRPERPFSPATGVLRYIIGLIPGDRMVAKPARDRFRCPYRS